MSKPWATIRRKHTVRRRAYARLVLPCLIGGDFRSLPFLISRSLTGERR